MLTAAHRIELRDFPLPEIDDDDGLLRIELAGVCGSDIHHWDGHSAVCRNVPALLGHEIVGRIEQTPPVYSALKVGGERAYALARAGRPPELAPRTVEIHSIERVASTAAGAMFEVACGKGTYVRALARDLAHRLGSLAYVSELRRTRVGPFTAST